MLNFELTDEQKMMQRTVRAFCEKNVAPIVEKMDKEKRIPDNIIKGLAELGILGMTVSKNYGGIEADAVTVGAVAEELARADISCAIPTLFLVQAAWGYILDKYGTEDAKEAILPKITSGRAFLGIAATEPDTGSDLANMRTVARKEGDYYIVNGEKMFISGVNEIVNQLPDGGGYVTLIKTEPEKGTRGMSMFYLPLNAKGRISPTLLEDWGRKGISTGGFALEDVEIPKEYLIGEENRGFYIAMEGFDFARAIISVVCCGAAMSCLEKGMEYIKMRHAFGVPIGKYEGTQFKLAENWSMLEAVRLLGYRALWKYSKEQKEKACDRFEVTKACAEAKLIAPVVAFNAINDAIQWYGAFGYTEECPLHLSLRGIRSYYWAEGTLEIMKIIVSRELLGKKFVAYR